MEKPELKISVRNLVEFILRSGDLNIGGFVSKDTMQEGTRIHRKLQKEGGDSYQAEVRLSTKKEFDDFVVEVHGIADGIIQKDDGIILDEIKTVSTPLEYVDENYSPLHWAQAQCYAYMLCVQNTLEDIRIQLTYYHIKTDTKKQLIKNWTFEKLARFFDDLLLKYHDFAQYSVHHNIKRDQSIKALPFPFEQYRKGQRELAVSVYYTVRDKKKLFAQAPTGTGKTISVLYPAIKAMGEGMGEKIFYLTAKTITRQVAEQAVQRMQKKGLCLKTITLTSKDRICPNKIRACNPEGCSNAEGHFNRVNTAILDILTHETYITRDILERYASKHRVCPFEYGLDISLFLDCIICDYNYVFDPRASLKRFFETGGDYTLLVDESHNLVDRAREMFSAELTKSIFADQRKKLKAYSPLVYKHLTKIIQWMNQLYKSMDIPEEMPTIPLPTALYSLVEKFIKAFEEFLGQSSARVIEDELMDLYFQCLSFIAVYKLYDERYVTYTVKENQDIRLKLFCIDPSYLLAKVCAKGRSTVFFSATLHPAKYFKDMLGGSGDDHAIRLLSPFDPDHLSIMVSGNISTRYKDRQGSFQLISDYIQHAVTQKTGNYLVFFPSFEYMRNVYRLYERSCPEQQLLLQNSSMDDAERIDFLSQFEEDPKKTMVAFAVMGGIFSEGIDLSGDRLSGAIIVGVGLPQICKERDLIRDYFKEPHNMGYEYAYMYPGMNRVLQAAGRVIRTENDRGFVLLLDDRFLHRRYIEIFPQEWSNCGKVYQPETVEKQLRSFWNIVEK